MSNRLTHNAFTLPKSDIIWLSSGLEAKGVVKEENPLSSQTRLLDM